MDTASKYTLTMARLYADQGYLRKAAEIYGHLVEKNPDRPELQSILEQLQQKIVLQQAPGKKELGLMIREWIDLLVEANQHRRKMQMDERK
jgi:hypothetical protein